MKPLRMLAGVLYAGGLLSFLLGLEAISLAQVCTEVEWTSATCSGAKAGKPVESDSGSYCEWANNECQATANSACVDRWGVAKEGDCIPDPLGSTTTFTCFEHSFVTLVNLTWFCAHCENENADCNCIWEKSNLTSPVQVCDCYDTENNW